MCNRTSILPSRPFVLGLLGLPIPAEFREIASNYLRWIQPTASTHCRHNRHTMLQSVANQLDFGLQAVYAVDDKVEQERDGVIELLQSKLLELEELQSSESEYDEETSDDDNGSCDESEESDEEYSDDEMLHNLVRKRNHFL